MLGTAQRQSLQMVPTYSSAHRVPYSSEPRTCMCLSSSVIASLCVSILKAVTQLPEQHWFCRMSGSQIAPTLCFHTDPRYGLRKSKGCPRYCHNVPSSTALSSSDGSRTCTASRCDSASSRSSISSAIGYTVSCSHSSKARDEHSPPAAHRIASRQHHPHGHQNSATVHSQTFQREETPDTQ